MTARARPAPARGNRTEVKYGWLLEAAKTRGEVYHYGFEEITLRLGDDCRYTPDYHVVTRDLTVEFHEVKGTYVRDDARVKLKAAAARFPFYRFLLCILTRGGGWEIEEVKP